MARGGDAFMAEAEKALNRTTFFGFGKSQKYEDAANAFMKAGNAYKLAGEYTKAGGAFRRSAEAHHNGDSSSNDMINSIVEAGNSYKMGNDNNNAVDAFNEAIMYYEENQRYGQCAKYQKEIAELYETCADYESAMGCYQKAARYFVTDNKKSQADQLNLKLAVMITTHSNKFIEGAQIFETRGVESLESRLGAFSAKGYFFQCLLCYLAAGDNVQVKNKLEAFKNKDHSFSVCRECQFIEKIVEALESYDSDGFAQACQDFDHITPLDPWKIGLLTKAKAQIGDEAGDAEVDLT